MKRCDKLQASKRMYITATGVVDEGVLMIQ